MSVTIHRNHYTTNAEPCQLFLMRFRKLFFNWRRTVDLNPTCRCGYAFDRQCACVLHLADGYAQPPTFRGINQWKTTTIFPKAIQGYHKNSQMSSKIAKNSTKKFCGGHKCPWQSLRFGLQFGLRTTTFSVYDGSLAPTRNTLCKSNKDFAYYIIKTAYFSIEFYPYKVKIFFFGDRVGNIGGMVDFVL